MNFIPENNLEYPIDAVILWVDGSDPLHQQKMEPFLEDKSKLNKKSFRTRFDQVEEVEFSINSILKFAPYIRNIFLVTDNQIPNFLKGEKLDKKYEKLKIIDHKVIFKGYESYLPTFNSRSIEAMLYKIPNLAEHFIYFNDDMFLMNKTKIEDFFIGGKPVLRGEWEKLYKDVFKKESKKKIKKMLRIEEKKRANHQVAQQKGAIINGFDKYYKFDHSPHPLRKSTFEIFFSINKDLENNNIKYKFRNVNQFIPQGLASHFEIKNGTCILKSDYQLLYLESYKKPLWWYQFLLNKINKNDDKLFLCLQSLDQCPPNKLKYILNWLKKRLKSKS